MARVRSIGRLLVGVVAVMHTSSALAEDIALELDLNTTHQLEAKALPGGGYEVRTAGDDPFVSTKPLERAYDPDRQYVLAFDYFAAKGLSNIELFFGDPATAGRSASGPEVLSSEGWTSYALNLKVCQEPGTWRGGYKRFRVDFGRHAGRTIQLRNLRLREPTARERKLAATALTRVQRAAAFDAQLQAMVRADYAIRITRVEATGDKLRITVDLPRDARDLLLCEVPIYQSPAGRTEFVWQQALPTAPRRTPIEIDRFRDGHDRVFSSFIVMRKTAGGIEPASHQRFVDTMPAKWSLKRDRPKSKKGLTGLHDSSPLLPADYRALGIHNATRNIVLPGLVKADAGANTIAHEFDGTTVHIDRAYLDQLDGSMIAMDELGVVVSGIILIPRGTPMAHPDATAQGIYAMANVVERDGWKLYAAGLDFLAQRYLRPDRRYGRMTHWILHNEVDAGWVWTNAGEKPLDSYVDLHYRSMRTCQSVIRRYGDAGSVLVSLTHYWTARHNSRCYQPRAMIDLIARRSSLEGDFDWGLAYHPYPENLRDPRTWLDGKVAFNFDTPLITPKNLEVLDAYMKQDRLRCDGRVRTIVLSEQGANSPGHDVQSYRNQAASLVYTWLKLEQLDSIESFVLHRWMDHPKEGGLNLGIRTNGRDGKEAKKKPAWEIYRKLGTPQQAEAVDWAKTVIPAEYFENIPAKVRE